MANLPLNEAHERGQGQHAEPGGAGGLLGSGWYSIEVQGHIDAHWSEWLDGLSIEHEAGGRTLLSGRIVDQAALNGLLNKIYNLGLPLLSLSRAEPEGEG